MRGSLENKLWFSIDHTLCINPVRFKKRYFTFWNNYNIIMDLFFMVGLLIRTLEYIIHDTTADISALRQAIQEISHRGR
jgi:hypothetical protein